MTPLKLQPIPYQGSKRALAPRIAKLFPRKVDTLYEPFAGSAAMVLYAAAHNSAKRFVIGDVYPELIGIWSLILSKPQTLCAEYRSVWEAQFSAGQKHFNLIRTRYNEERRPAQLLYLIARCVKNAVRFGRDGTFTQSVDKRRRGVHPDRLEQTIRKASSLLADRTDVFCGDFRECIAATRATDLVYMDPPYHGTTYSRDKRYAVQLEREALIEGISELNSRRVPFILSYDGRTGEKEYSEKLPPELRMTHFYINAGRSSQATLSGRSDTTFESLYISSGIAAAGIHGHLGFPEGSYPQATRSMIAGTFGWLV